MLFPPSYIPSFFLSFLLDFKPTSRLHANACSQVHFRYLQAAVHHLQHPQHLQGAYRRLHGWLALGGATLANLARNSRITKRILHGAAAYVERRNTDPGLRWIPPSRRDERYSRRYVPQISVHLISTLMGLVGPFQRSAARARHFQSEIWYSVGWARTAGNGRSVDLRVSVNLEARGERQRIEHRRRVYFESIQYEYEPCISVELCLCSITKTLSKKCHLQSKRSIER